MESIIYIKSLHRPYNQNLNSVKWVCKFIKNNKEEISKSDFYLDFYIYIVEKFYNAYKKRPEQPLSHGIPLYDSIERSYDALIAQSKENKRKIIMQALVKRETETARSIFNTYKAASYFINLAKDKLQFVDNDNNLRNSGEILTGLRSRDFNLSKKEKEILFSSILKNDFHFFISQALFYKSIKNATSLSIEETHFDFLVEQFNMRHFKYTEASNQVNYSKIREHWIRDLDLLDKNLNIRKPFLEIISEDGFEANYQEIKDQVNKYYKNKVVPKIKIQKKIELFMEVYKTEQKNELGFLPLQDIADKMNMGKKTFQNLISEFYELERNKYNIYFNNVVQAISGKSQYLIRNRPVVNIRIKELN